MVCPALLLIPGMHLALRVFIHTTDTLPLPLSWYLMSQSAPSLAHIAWRSISLCCCATKRLGEKKYLLVRKEFVCEASHRSERSMLEQVIRSHHSGLPPPVPQESITIWSCRPARSTTLLNTASAVGLRHMLPTQDAGIAT